MLDKQVSLYRLVMNARSIQMKGMKPGAHLACRHHENTRNIDSLLHDESGSLVHDIGNIWLCADTSQWV
jgi:hypothetical protein